MGAIAVDPGGDLDDGIVGQVRQRAVVADVDDLDVAGPGVERGDELGRRLAVERPAAAFQEGRLRDELRVAVQVEEASARSP